jgi:hypothetical protein
MKKMDLLELAWAMEDVQERKDVHSSQCQRTGQLQDAAASIQALSLDLHGNVVVLANGYSLVGGGQLVQLRGQRQEEAFGQLARAHDRDFNRGQREINKAETEGSLAGVVGIFVFILILGLADGRDVTEEKAQ